MSRASTPRSGDFVMELKNVKRDASRNTPTSTTPSASKGQRWDVIRDRHQGGHRLPARPDEMTSHAAALVKTVVSAWPKGPICPHAEAVRSSRKQRSLRPGKAANAGRRGHSGLEMSQNSMKLSWTEKGGQPPAHHHEKHPQGAWRGRGLWQEGRLRDQRNIAGFTKVARAMLAYGVV